MPHFVDITTAAHRLAMARRISVIGCSGGGKTTLSRRLGKALGLPHISMDREIYWLPGWQKRPVSDTRSLIASTVTGDRWIMDGTGASSFDLRLPRTDLVLWVRMSRWLCLWGVGCRVLSSIGRVRPDMAPGCPEKLPDREFLAYIWTFEQRFSPRIVEAIDNHGPEVPVFVLKRRRDIARLLDLVGASD